MTDVTAHVQSRAVGPWIQPTPCTCSHKVPAVLAPVTALGSVPRLLPQHSTSRKHSFLLLPDGRTPADPAPTCSSSRAVTAQGSDPADPPARPGAPTPPTTLTPPTSPTPRTPLAHPPHRLRGPADPTDPADRTGRLTPPTPPRASSPVRPSGENARSAPFGTGNRSSHPPPRPLAPTHATLRSPLSPPPRPLPGPPRPPRLLPAPSSHSPPRQPGLSPRRRLQASA